VSNDGRVIKDGQEHGKEALACTVWEKPQIQSLMNTKQKY